MPREHGSWVMLALPPLLPLLALRAWKPAAGPALLAILALFLAREPLRLRVRRAGSPAAATAPLLLAGAAGLAALLLSRSPALAGWALLALAVLGGDLAFARAGRLSPRQTLLRELMGVLGLTAGAPATAAALGAPLAFQLAVWLLAWLPFTLGALHVDRFIDWRRSGAVEGERRRSALRLFLGACGGAALGVAALAALAPLSGLPAVAALAWSPELLHLAWTAWRPRARADFKRLGLEETLSGTLWLLVGLVLATRP
ncbi:MAG: YwiC-like family protein [Bacillota bacterium]|nr:YwiC-like family protein [Bacillota bacterium]